MYMQYMYSKLQQSLAFIRCQNENKQYDNMDIQVIRQFFTIAMEFY